MSHVCIVCLTHCFEHEKNHSHCATPDVLSFQLSENVNDCCLSSLLAEERSRHCPYYLPLPAGSGYKTNREHVFPQPCVLKREKEKPSPVSVQAVAPVNNLEAEKLASV